MTTYIQVNKQVIASNRKNGTNEPAVSFRKGKYGKPTYAFEVEWDGPSKVIYSPHKPLLPCGARLVIATEANVRVIK